MKLLCEMTLGVLVLLLIAVSCGNDESSTGPGTITDPVSEFATLQVTAENEHGEPVSGAKVRISYTDTTGSVTSYSIMTDDAGIALFDSLAAGVAKITINSPNDAPTVSFENRRILTPGQTCDVEFLLPVGPIPITVIATEKQNGEFIPMIGADIIIADRNGAVYQQTTTDTEGRGLFESVGTEMFGQIWSMFNFQFFRNGSTAKSALILEKLGSKDFYEYIDGELYMNLEVTFSPDAPTILSPEPNEQLIGPYVSLSCTGYDFTDGELSGSSFVWYSDREGELGRGSDIIAHMSTGLHKVSVDGIDSNNIRGNSSSLFVYVSHFADGSYFPMPFDGYWKYAAYPASFVITNEWGETEQWTIEDMTVTIEDIGIRTCTMDWLITRDHATMNAEYTVTDQISIDGDVFTISSTEEFLKVFDGQVFWDYEAQVEELKVQTTYEPDCPFLSSYINPHAGGYTETTVHAQTNIVWSLSDASAYHGNGDHSYQYQEDILVAYDPETTTTVTTPAGAFDAQVLTSRIGDIERIWYMVPNIGVVQFDTTVFDVPITAQLIESNMDTYTLVGWPAKTSGAPEQRVANVTIANDQERMVTLRTMMRSLCPF